MRKILLATSALVAFASAAQAAESPIAVNVGGYVDFVAALFDQSNKLNANERTGDFTNEFQINVDASGKAASGVEYGAHVGIWNGTRDAGSTIAEKDAYVWVSGNFGKVILGDTLAANVELFVAAPSVGSGQVFSKFTDFMGNYVAPMTPFYTYDNNYSTRITYYTPKIGTEKHKVQFGASFTPNDGTVGHQTIRTPANVESNGHYDYQNVISVAAQYTGKFDPFTVVVSPNYTTGQGFLQNSLELRDYSTYGLGAQVSYDKLTIGGSYLDAGHVYTQSNQTKAQSVWTLGTKYDFGNLEVAANYMNIRGYRLGFSNSYGDNYGRVGQNYGLGAVYTWFPGFTTAVDGILSTAKADLTGTALPEKNINRVLMISQKMVF